MSTNLSNPINDLKPSFSKRNKRFIQMGITCTLLVFGSVAVFHDNIDKIYLKTTGKTVFQSVEQTRYSIWNDKYQDFRKLQNYRLSNLREDIEYAPKNETNISYDFENKRYHTKTYIINAFKDETTFKTEMNMLDSLMELLNDSSFYPQKPYSEPVEYAKDTGEKKQTSDNTSGLNSYATFMIMNAALQPPKP